MNGKNVGRAPLPAKTESSENQVNTIDHVWEVVTRGKVQVQFNGMLTIYDSTADFKVVFTSEPTVTSRPRATNQNLESSRAFTAKAPINRQAEEIENQAVSESGKNLKQNSAGQLRLEDT